VVDIRLAKVYDSAATICAKKALPAPNGLANDVLVFGTGIFRSHLILYNKY